MAKKDIIKLSDYKCILAFNDSEECYLFKSENLAKKEAVSSFKTENAPTEAYIIPIKVKKILQYKLIEKLIEKDGRKNR